MNVDRYSQHHTKRYPAQVMQCHECSKSHQFAKVCGSQLKLQRNTKAKHIHEHTQLVRWEQSSDDDAETSVCL